MKFKACLRKVLLLHVHLSGSRELDGDVGGKTIYIIFFFIYCHLNYIKEKNIYNITFQVSWMPETSL